eukprot:scaffold61486_cov28-Tisochrysis_lutea.AAC.3
MPPIERELLPPALACTNGLERFVRPPDGTPLRHGHSHRRVGVVISRWKRLTEPSDALPRTDASPPSRPAATWTHDVPWWLMSALPFGCKGGARRASRWYVTTSPSDRSSSNLVSPAACRV